MSQPSKITGKFTFPSPQECIYCGRADGNLRDEHIVPFALRGEIVFKNASCEPCGAITHAFEGKCCDRFFNVTRMALGYGSRRRGKRATEFPFFYKDKTGQERIGKARAEAHPVGLMLPKFVVLPPKLRTIDQPFPLKLQFWRAGPATDRVAELAKSIDANAIGSNLDLLSLARLLAKIGHSFCRGTLGATQFSPFLVPLILGQSDDWQQFIGGEMVDAPAIAGRHAIKVEVFNVAGRHILACNVRLFANLGAPNYVVAVGQLLSPERPELTIG